MTRLISFLAHAVYMGTPLLFGTVGEIQNEKAGHLNLGVEGTMAMGACARLYGSIQDRKPLAFHTCGISYGCACFPYLCFSYHNNDGEPKRNRSYTDYIRHGTFKLHRRADDIRFTYRQPSNCLTE